MRALGSIETGLKNAYQQEFDTSGTGVGPFVHTFCPTSASPVPAAIPQGPVAVPSSDWNTETWRCLKFSFSEPVRCQYSFESNGLIGDKARGTATVRCDPDGDGVLVVARLAVAGDASGDSRRLAMTLTGARAPVEPPGKKAPPARDAVAAVRRYERRVCACADASCAQQATDDFSAEVERFKQTKGSDADARDIEESMKRALDCNMRLQSATP